jgi:hypothetical protein
VIERRSLSSGAVVVLAFALLGAAPAALGAKDGPPVRELTAKFAFSGPQGDREIGATILVDRVTSVEEAHRLKKLLETQGQGGLLAAIRGHRDGRLSFGGLEYSLDLIVAHQVDDELELWIVTTRPIHADEIATGADSLDHPFGVAHIHVDGFGRGEGDYFPVCALSIAENGELEITQAVEGEGRVSEVRKTK